MLAKNKTDIANYHKFGKQNLGFCFSNKRQRFLLLEIDGFDNDGA